MHMQTFVLKCNLSAAVSQLDTQILLLQLQLQM